MPPPNTPEEGELDSSDSSETTTTTTTPVTTAQLPLRTRPQPRALGAMSSPDDAAAAAETNTVACVVDLRTVDYVDAVDENLVCPICRVALVDPVITVCDHVFCWRCLDQAHALSPNCPIDRQPLDGEEMFLAPKIITNQLDSLRVKCPNHDRGCDLVVARSLVENHVSRYCDKTMVPCPHPGCINRVARRDAAKGCLHYEVRCEYCKGTMLKADLEEHQDRECPNREAQCERCGADYLRNKHDEHIQECPEAETQCRFAPFGCATKTVRKLLDDHAAACEYRVVGPVGQQIMELRSELAALQEKDRLKDRRIKFLENKGFSMPATVSASEQQAMTEMNLAPETSLSSSSTATAESRPPYESRDQYFLQLFETIDHKVERLSTGLQEVDGRHSLHMIHETMQIKDQLTEIRSTLGVLGMHVRWLMNFRLQERGRVAPSSSGMTSSMAGSQHGSSGTGTGTGTGTGSALNLPRRLSDPDRHARL